MLLVLPPRSGGQQSHKVLVVFPDARIGFLQLDYLLAGVQHRGVVPAAKGIANFWQTVVGQFLGQGHRHLAGPGDGTGPALGQQIRYLDLVILRHGTLNIINTDLLFMQCQQVFQAFPDKRRSDLRPVKGAFAITKRSAPSSSRTLERIFCAIKKAASLLSFTLACSAFFIRMATRVSSSGGSTITVRPQPNRDFSRSSIYTISFGKRSQVTITCWPPSSKALKVWKNSSWERSLRAKNWISSISSASTER